MTNILLDKLENDIESMDLHFLAKSRTEKGVYLLYCDGKTILDFDGLACLSRLYRSVLNYNYEIKIGQFSPKKLEDEYNFEISKISEENKTLLAYRTDLILFELRNN